MTDEEFAQLVADWKAAKKKVKKWAKTELALEQQVKESCPHTDKVQHEAYHSGGYDYTASTNYWIQCVLCKKTLKSWVEDHGYYG